MWSSLHLAVSAVPAVVWHRGGLLDCDSRRWCIHYLGAGAAPGGRLVGLTNSNEHLATSIYIVTKVRPPAAALENLHALVCFRCSRCLAFVLVVHDVTDVSRPWVRTCFLPCLSHPGNRCFAVGSTEP